MQNLFSDPFSLIMLALIAVLIIFMVRNGKKRQAAMAQLQSGLVPGAEVMLQSGIYGTVDDIDEEGNRVTLRSGSSTFIVHRNAVSTIVAPIEAVEEPGNSIAPDDDPAFGEHADAANAANAADIAPTEPETPQYRSPFDPQADQKPDTDDANGDDAPKA